MSFVRGTGQSLESSRAAPSGRNAGGSGSEHIAARLHANRKSGGTKFSCEIFLRNHLLGYPQKGQAARVMQQKRPPISDSPLESPVACLQSLAHVVISPCRSTPFAGHPKQRERETPPAPATPTQRKTAVPVHDLHDWNSRPLVPVLPSPAFLASSLQCFA